jgi:SAM-dependent methyltransferase
VKRLSEPKRLSESDLSLLDDIASRIRPDDRSLDGWYDTYRENHRRRLAADLGIVSAHVKPDAEVLEYGAVPLLLTAALAERGFRVSAVDLDPDRFATAIARLGLHVARCDVEQEAVPFAEESFDAIVFNELFEHLRINPVFTLRQAHRVLRPDGVLLLSTPNLRSFRGIRNLVVRNQGHAVSAGVYEQYQKLEKVGHMGHVREYTTREVADFLTRIGFRIDAIIYRGGHGAGLVGLAERLAPSMRPFFTVVAAKDVRA